MRKLSIVSVVLAALLVSGCNQKSEEHKKEQSAPVKVEQNVVKEESAKPAKQAKPVAQEAAKEHAQKAKTSEVTKAKESVVQKTAQVQAAGDGAKLYAKCAACHGPQGKRKALGKSAVIAGMPKDEVLKKLKGYQSGKENLYGMGALMKGQVAGLSEAELAALADYISKLR